MPCCLSSPLAITGSFAEPLPMNHVVGDGHADPLKPALQLAVVKHDEGMAEGFLPVPNDLALVERHSFKLAHVGLLAAQHRVLRDARPSAALRWASSSRRCRWPADRSRSPATPRRCRTSNTCRRRFAVRWCRPAWDRTAPCRRQPASDPIRRAGSPGSFPVFAQCNRSPLRARNVS